MNKLKDSFTSLYEKIDAKFMDQFGFNIKETSFTKIADYLHEPKDSSSLAVSRILFGLCMLIDIPSERGGAQLVHRWGDPLKCHFPLLTFLRPLPMPYMALVYAALWIGALGIMLGFKYRLTAPMFTACYWYLFLLEKSYWNNHSYLFGLVAFLLCSTDANSFWSLDTYLNPSSTKPTVPYWNYFILKYQFFILYFMAGVKKGSVEWLAGYSMINLSRHWVFAPFRIFLSVPTIDYLIVHWFIFAFDLTIAVWMMWGRTRHVAMLFCALFHLMNSRLFAIGMFPWVCLATMPLFYPFDWPKKAKALFDSLIQNFKTKLSDYFWEYCPICDCHANGDDIFDDNHVIDENGTVVEHIDDLITEKDTGHAIIGDEKNYMNEDDHMKTNEDCTIKEQDGAHNAKGNETDSNTLGNNKFDVNAVKETGYEDKSTITDLIDVNKVVTEKRKKITTLMILLYVLTQAFLPFSHFITKGFNTWTKGLYGYSWDMMVHKWDTNMVVIRIVDNIHQREFFLDPDLCAPTPRWTTHGDMAYQYAHCLKNTIIKKSLKHTNVSIYFDVWTSLNERFTQRIFDPKMDVLGTSWSVFEEVPFVMPLIDNEGLGWRKRLLEIADEVASWNNRSEVLFLADFPGYELEKYLAPELSNVTLSILKGQVIFEPEVLPIFNGQSHILNNGDKIQIQSGTFHRVITIGDAPAFFMYTFYNSSAQFEEKKEKPMLPLFQEWAHWFHNMERFVIIVFESIYLVIFGCVDC